MINDADKRTQSSLLMNDQEGRHVRDLFLADGMKEYLNSLAHTFGFTLSVYSPSGTAIGGTIMPFPPCGTLHASNECSAQTETTCYAELVNAARTGVPNVYSCHAKMINFVVPVVYMLEKAVVLGHSAFASSKDYRDYVNFMSSRGLQEMTVPAPKTYVSKKQAWKACQFVSDSLRHVLGYAEENDGLKKKIEGVKDVFVQWHGAPDEQPDMLYRSLIDKLFALMDIGCITILTLDKQQRRYTSLYSLKYRTEKALVHSISEQDVIVKDLLGGKQYVLYRVPRTDQQDIARHGSRSWYFFPLMVKNSLDAILAISDRMLKDDDINIISALCRQASLLIENQRLSGDLTRKVSRLTVASALPGTVTNQQDYKALLQMILDKSAELLMAEQGTLMLLDQVTEALSIQAKKGIKRNFPEDVAIPKGEGIAGKVAVHGEPVLVRNLEEDPRFRQKNKQHYKTHSFLSVPLKIEGRIIGVINLADKISGDVFDEEDLKLIQAFATQAAFVLDRRELYDQTEELKRLSITDHLTGLLNRRYLQDRLEEELARSKRYDRNLCLLMIDLDGFKHFNDSFGHLIGDKILKNVAEAIMNSVRTIDVVSRYGGDEFIVILPETELPLAVKIAERLLDDIAKRALPKDVYAADNGAMLTASIGIVSYPQDGTTTAQLLENVDRAMYSAKHAGKNRVHVL